MENCFCAYVNTVSSNTNSRKSNPIETKINWRTKETFWRTLIRKCMSSLRKLHVINTFENQKVIAMRLNKIIPLDYPWNKTTCFPYLNKKANRVETTKINTFLPIQFFTIIEFKQIKSCDIKLAYPKIMVCFHNTEFLPCKALLYLNSWLKKSRSTHSGEYYKLIIDRSHICRRMYTTPFFIPWHTKSRIKQKHFYTSPFLFCSISFISKR